MVATGADHLVSGSIKAYQHAIGKKAEEAMQGTVMTSTVQHVLIKQASSGNITPEETQYRYDVFCMYYIAAEYTSACASISMSATAIYRATSSSKVWGGEIAFDYAGNTQKVMVAVKNTASVDGVAMVTIYSTTSMSADVMGLTSSDPQGDGEAFSDPTVEAYYQDMKHLYTREEIVVND